MALQQHDLFSREAAVSSEFELNVAQNITNRIASLLGSKLQKVILFGSRARGDARKDSDYDFVVIADFDEPSWITRLSEISNYVGSYKNFGVEVDYIPVTKWEFENKFLFSFSVLKEGVVMFMQDEVSLWLKKANDDMTMAKAANASGIWDHVCYHAVQACEKSMKAVICHLGVMVPRTHDLLALFDTLVEFAVPIPAGLRSRLETINGLDAIVRYLGYDSTQSDSEKVFNNAKAVIAFVEEYFLHNYPVE